MRHTTYHVISAEPVRHDIGFLLNFRLKRKRVCISCYRGIVISIYNYFEVSFRWHFFILFIIFKRFFNYIRELIYKEEE